MANEHTRKADARQTDQYPTPSIQAYPDTQGFSHANAPRTDNNPITPLGAEEFDKVITQQVTQSRTPSAQKPFFAPGGIWVFTWNEIVNGIIQVVAVVAALVFGAWAIKSYDEAQQANTLARTGLQQTLIANQLALLAVCASNQDIGNSTACADVFTAISLNNIVSALSLVPSSTVPTSTYLPSPSSKPTTTLPNASRARPVLTLPIIIGIVVGIVCAVALLLAGYIGFSRRGRVWLQE